MLPGRSALRRLHGSGAAWLPPGTTRVAMPYATWSGRFTRADAAARLLSPLIVAAGPPGLRLGDATMRGHLMCSALSAWCAAWQGVG